MMRSPEKLVFLAIAVAVLWCASAAHADESMVAAANARAAEVAATVRATPLAVRTMAMVQVAVFDAVQSLHGRYRPLCNEPTAPSPGSADAAVVAASRALLLASVPAQRERIESDARELLARLPEGADKARGIAAGEQAAAKVLAMRAGDGADAVVSYRPRTRAGEYVPTTLPLVPGWGRRRPWGMATGAEFRPGPPPAPASDVARRDLAEIAALGGRTSTRRTPEQTAMARFWETTSPAVYWPVVRSLAAAYPADVDETSRWFAEAAIAMDDAMIAVFDAKYAYALWRPITAIRSGFASVSDSTWEPLIETPMHPEYPCAHCIVSAAVAQVLESELAGRRSPTLRSVSPTGSGERTWPDPAAFAREVSEARIAAGVHYRNSTEVGRDMGRRIGERAGRRFQSRTP